MKGKQEELVRAALKRRDAAGLRKLAHKSRLPGRRMMLLFLSDLMAYQASANKRRPAAPGSSTTLRRAS